MSHAPEGGVLAPDLTVHGVENLSVVSSSAFCSSSQANPTFLLVALALRKADALRSRLPRHGMDGHHSAVRRQHASVSPTPRRSCRPVFPPIGRERV